MGQILSILWEIMSILWEICYLIGIFRNHSSPPPPPPVDNNFGKFLRKIFLTTRAQSEKVEKFLSTPLIFSFPYAHDNFALKTILCLPFEISKSLKTFKTSTNQYLVSNEYFYMFNPCCNVTKTIRTVNEIKKLLKMADISLILQVKIFQELSKI